MGLERVTRGRIEREKAFLFWQEMMELPVRVIEIAVDEKLLELALKHNLALCDASYLRRSRRHQTLTPSCDFLTVRPSRL